MKFSLNRAQALLFTRTFSTAKEGFATLFARAKGGSLEFYGLSNNKDLILYYVHRKLAGSASATNVVVDGLAFGRAVKTCSDFLGNENAQMDLTIGTDRVTVDVVLDGEKIVRRTALFLIDSSSHLDPLKSRPTTGTEIKVADCRSWRERMGAVSDAVEEGTVEIAAKGSEFRISAIPKGIENFAASSCLVAGPPVSVRLLFAHLNTIAEVALVAPSSSLRFMVPSAGPIMASFSAGDEEVVFLMARAS